MKINLLRYHNIEGRRETDKGAVVQWDVDLDKDSVLFVTEGGTKYKLNIKIGGEIENSD